MAVLEERMRLGVALWHPDDAVGCRWPVLIRVPQLGPAAAPTSPGDVPSQLTRLPGWVFGGRPCAAFGADAVASPKPRRETPGPVRGRLTTAEARQVIVDAIQTGTAVKRLAERLTVATGRRCSTMGAWQARKRVLLELTRQSA